MPCPNAPVRGHQNARTAANCRYCGGGASGASGGSSTGNAGRPNLPPPSLAVEQSSNAPNDAAVEKSAEILVQLSLSDDKSTELVDILATAVCDVVDEAGGRRRSSHLLCELFNSAARFLEDNAPKSLAQQVIEIIVGSALDNAGGVLAAAPCKTIVVTAVKEFTEKLTDALAEKLTDALAIPDIAKIVMALRLLTILVCPNLCPAYDEAELALGKSFIGEALADTGPGQQ